MERWAELESTNDREIKISTGGLLVDAPRCPAIDPLPRCSVMRRGAGYRDKPVLPPYSGLLFGARSPISRSWYGRSQGTSSGTSCEPEGFHDPRSSGSRLRARGFVLHAGQKPRGETCASPGLGPPPQAEKRGFYRPLGGWHVIRVREGDPPSGFDVAVVDHFQGAEITPRNQDEQIGIRQLA